jgi:hypothetical protein
MSLLFFIRLDFSISHVLTNPSMKSEELVSTSSISLEELFQTSSIDSNIFHVKYSNTHRRTSYEFLRCTSENLKTTLLILVLSPTTFIVAIDKLIICISSPPFSLFVEHQECMYSSQERVLQSLIYTSSTDFDPPCVNKLQLSPQCPFPVIL